jgi:hypothetical protein
MTLKLIKTLREPRIAGLAIFDVTGTVLGAYLVADKFNWSKPKTIVGAFVFGHLVHIVFKIDTKLNPVPENSE